MSGGGNPFWHPESKIINLVKTTIFGKVLGDYPSFVPIVWQNWGNIQGHYTETVPVPFIEDLGKSWVIFKDVSRKQFRSPFFLESEQFSDKIVLN